MLFGHLYLILRTTVGTDLASLAGREEGHCGYKVECLVICCGAGR